MHFLFVDRILELSPGKAVRGVKHVTPNDYYLTEGWQKQPALLDCIVGETLGQLAAWNIMHTIDFAKRPVAGVVGQITLSRQAYVGETIFLEAFIDSFDDDVVRYHGCASVNGETVLTIESALGPLLPMSDFIDSNVVKAQFAVLNRPGTIEQAASGDIIDPFDTVVPMQDDYDRILHWEMGVTVTAQKNISITTPCFVDHFPRKPVFPMSLLLNCHLQLGYRFLKELLSAEQFKHLRVAAIKRSKMNAFIQPGDSVITHMRLKEKTNDTFTLTFRSEVDGKRVGVAEAVFKGGFNG